MAIAFAYMFAIAYAASFIAYILLARWGAEKSGVDAPPIGDRIVLDLDLDSLGLF